MGIPTRLVQLTHPDEGRRTALVYENELHLLATYRSAYSFAVAALETGWTLRDLLSTDLSGIVLDYAEVHALATPWRFLPSFDHPDAPGRCLVSAAGVAGDGPMWRYQGYGAILRGHGEPLALAGSSLPAAPGEVAAVYLIGYDGAPRRVGVTPGSGSGVKATLCAIGPELTLDTAFPTLEGAARLSRAGHTVWSEELPGGEVPLPLALAAIEPDHFESGDQRAPGDAHIHFFGGRLFGVREGMAVEDGDQVAVEFPRLGRALRNPIRLERPALHRVAAVPL